MNNTDLKLHDAIDLLTEGEMEQDSRDALFARLDLDPIGWKRCALALLEQRALQRSMGDPMSHGSLPQFSSIGASPGTWLVPGWQRFAGLAAMVMILIAVAWVAGERTGSSRSYTSANRWNKPSAVQAAPPAVPTDDELMRQVSFALESTGSLDAELVALVRVGDESNRKFYPIVRSNDLAQKMTALPDQKLSTEAVHTLHQSGWELNKHQQFISFKLPNGITKALPVDMLTYRFVGRETF